MITRNVRAFRSDLFFIKQCTKKSKYFVFRESDDRRQIAFFPADTRARIKPRLDSLYRCLVENVQHGSLSLHVIVYLSHLG